MQQIPLANNWYVYPRDETELDGWLFSRLWLEDAAGTVVLGSGEEIDVIREGWELVAAGFEGALTEDTFVSPLVRLSGLGVLAVYRRA